MAGFGGLKHIHQHPTKLFIYSLMRNPSPKPDTDRGGFLGFPPCSGKCKPQAAESATGIERNPSGSPVIASGNVSFAYARFQPAGRLILIESRSTAGLHTTESSPF
jgi:hypothetical protein